jgi:hypothetical protein
VWGRAPPPVQAERKLGSCLWPQQLLARSQLARMRDTVSVPREPPITHVDQPIEPWQTENRIEGPCPPDPSRRIQINIGSRYQLTIRRQQPYVSKQFFMRQFDPLRHPRLIQRGNLESMPSERPRPVLRPTRAEAALSVVKDDALDLALDHSGFSAHRHTHKLRPHITVTADPSARKADCGLPRSTVAISFPYNFSASPSNADPRTCQTLHEGCVTRYSTQPPPG